jgi:hypothetical protein
VPRESPQTKSEAAKVLATAGRLAPPVIKKPPAAKPALDLTHKTAEEPFSHFSERMRSIKTALDGLAQLNPVQCIGVISAVPGEGKSTAAVNLAQARAELIIRAASNPATTTGNAALQLQSTRSRRAAVDFIHSFADLISIDAPTKCSKIF